MRTRRCGSASPACRARARRCSSPRSSTTSCTAARLPVFNAYAKGRIARARLEPQPDDAVPRFAYEDHVAALIGPDRHWPESTRRISRTAPRRSTTKPRGLVARIGRGTLHARHRRLSRRMAARPAAARQGLRRRGRAETLAASRAPARRARWPRDWLAHLATLDPLARGRRGRRARELADAVHRLSARLPRRRAVRCRRCRPAAS